MRQQIPRHQRGVKVKTKLILQLQTAPAVCAIDRELSDGNFNRFRKELIKVGKFIKASTDQAFEVTTATLDHWVETFNRWIANGNKVPVPLGHEAANSPDKNAGWVVKMHREGDVLIGFLELVDKKLALTTDVSICVEDEFIDGKGNKYDQPITHVALTTRPVIPGLGAFTQLSLSLGDTQMDVKMLAKMLGLSEDSSEELVLAGITKLVETKVAPPAKTLGLETPVAVAVDPLLIKLMGENRQAKLTTLLSAGLITPAVGEIIKKKYVEVESLTLSLSKGTDDGFDTLFEVLASNKTVELGEKTSAQLLELANTRAKAPANPIAADVTRRREEAGLAK